MQSIMRVVCVSTWCGMIGTTPHWFKHPNPIVQCGRVCVVMCVWTSAARHWFYRVKVIGFTNLSQQSDQESAGVLQLRRLMSAWDHPSELNGRWSSLRPGRKCTNTIAAETQGALYLLIIHLRTDKAALICPLLPWTSSATRQGQAPCWRITIDPLHTCTQAEHWKAML